MAIEDAVVLGRNLDQNGDVPASLQRYNAQRRKRANGIVRSARRQGILYHGGNPVIATFRDLFSNSPVPIAMRVVDGLMGYEA